jgi:hypothetical protein
MPGTQRGVSTSSMRSSQRPRCARASSQLASAATSEPACSGPVGEGAKRPGMPPAEPVGPVPGRARARFRHGRSDQPPGVAVDQRAPRGGAVQLRQPPGQRAPRPSGLRSAAPGVVQPRHRFAACGRAAPGGRPPGAAAPAARAGSRSPGRAAAPRAWRACCGTVSTSCPGSRFTVSGARRCAVSATATARWCSSSASSSGSLARPAGGAARRRRRRAPRPAVRSSMPPGLAWSAETPMARSAWPTPAPPRCRPARRCAGAAACPDRLAVGRRCAQRRRPRTSSNTWASRGCRPR